MKNKVKEVLKQKGFGQVHPTEEKLRWLCGTPHRFNKILNNRTEMTASELVRFAEWLGVEVNELLTK